MADNVTFQSGTLATAPDGSVIGTDNIGGIIYQRVKIVWGIDGVVTDTSAINPLPVTLAAGVAVIGHVITDTGSTTAVTGTVAVTQSTSPWVVSGTVTNSAAKAGTGTQTSVAATGADQTILASNANRLGGSVFNDSTAIFYLLLSNATSSATAFTAKLIPNDYYEIPANYTGVLKGFYASATGNARVTEYTA